MTFWPGKMTGITVGMIVFFGVYSWILKHPISPPVVMPLTAIDRVVGFWPSMLPLYFSLWVYISLGPALVTDRRELISHGVAAVVLAALGLGLFFLFPTIVPDPQIDWSQFPAFVFLKTIDAAGNACPSLHVAFALLSAIWLERLLRTLQVNPRLCALNWLWCAGIIFSTVAIKQHVALDVLAGALLGLGVAFAHLRWMRDRC